MIFFRFPGKLYIRFITLQQTHCFELSPCILPSDLYE